MLGPIFSAYDGEHTWTKLTSRNINSKLLVANFKEWLSRYVEIDIVPADLKESALMHCNNKIYSKLETKKIFAQAIVDYISGMTDRFAIRVFNELISYE